jgi:hypothetical protein
MPRYLDQDRQHMVDDTEATPSLMFVVRNDLFLVLKTCDQVLGFRLVFGSLDRATLCKNVCPILAGHVCWSFRQQRPFQSETLSR